MNFIKRLQKEATEKDQRIEDLEEGLRRIKSYVCSSKFHQDQNVNVSDIILRVEEVLQS